MLNIAQWIGSEDVNGATGVQIPLEVEFLKSYFFFHQPLEKKLTHRHTQIHTHTHTHTHTHKLTHRKFHLM